MTGGTFRLKGTVTKRVVSSGPFGTHSALTIKLDGGGSVKGETTVTYIADGKGLNDDWHALRQGDEVQVEVGL